MMTTQDLRNYRNALREQQDLAIATGFEDSPEAIAKAERFHEQHAQSHGNLTKKTE